MISSEQIGFHIDPGIVGDLAQPDKQQAYLRPEVSVLLVVSSREPASRVLVFWIPACSRERRPIDPPGRTRLGASLSYFLFFEFARFLQVFRMSLFD
jgi:hypothetical protein